MEHLELLELLDPLEHQAMLDRKALQARQDTPDQMDNRVLQGQVDLLVRKDREETLDHLGLRAILVTKEHRERMERSAQLVLMDNRVL